MSRARASVALALIASSATVLHLHHRTPASSATSAAPAAGAVLSLVREPAPPTRLTPRRASRRRTRTVLRAVPTGDYADVTAYCATGARNAAGRWPAVGDVAVLDRTIPFGTRVLVDGNVFTVEDWIGRGSDYDLFFGDGPDCERRALDFGRRRLRVVVKR